MKASWFALYGCLTLVGCAAETGSESEETAQHSPLVGTWAVELNDSCVSGWAFDGSRFEGMSMCALESGTYGIETERGTYSATNSQINLFPEEASCVRNRTHAPFAFEYTVNDEVLQLSSNAGVAVFTRWSGQQGAGGVARYGCIEPGTFSDGEIVPVN